MLYPKNVTIKNLATGESEYYYCEIIHSGDRGYELQCCKNGLVHRVCGVPMMGMQLIYSGESIVGKNYEEYR